MDSAYALALGTNGQAEASLPVLPAASTSEHDGSNRRAPKATAAIQFDAAGSSAAAEAIPPDDRAASAQATVEDAPLPPRRRAQDSAQAAGFPASSHIAQLLAQNAFPPPTTAPGMGLSNYQAISARIGAAADRKISVLA